MSAIISDCGRYRYRLTRQCNVLLPDRGSALFVMLNPSTADANLDDPTIRRCIGFAESWGCPGLAVGNVYGFRATDPKELLTVRDPVGPENDLYLFRLAQEYGDVVCAWGKHAKADRVRQVVDIFTKARARMWCLGTNKDGSPKHPLYLRADTQMVEWKLKTEGGNDGQA